MSVIVDNDTYFDGHTELDSGDMCAGILQSSIQLASHVYRKRSFTGRAV